MFKNQLQELAQRSCFNLPSYTCIREGPDHAPRFKASVNFNGEIFESPNFCPTLRQAEHSAAEAALNVLSVRGLSRSLTARVLDETGVYKNLLQETAHRAGLKLPVYITVRSGPGHSPIFSCIVELAGMNFTGEPAKTKKQAEKNAAIAAWSALKTMPNLDSWTKEDSKQFRRRDHNNRAKRRMVNGNNNDIISLPSSSTSAGKSLNHKKWRVMDVLMDSSAQKRNGFLSLLPPPPPRTASKILPPTSSNYSCNRAGPIQIRGKPEMKLVPPLEQHLKDEDQWPGSKHEHVINKSIEKEGSSSELISRICGSPYPSQMAPAMARNMYTGGFNPHKIAPAVKMRSIIPVCAAPPPANRPNTMQIGPAEVPSSSASSVMFNKSGPNSYQLSSELMKLQLTK
ncbi:double-stranded RNA-binding protein 3-like isoform X2 [Hibiscus syriacus]|uniref:double-stranded RNA-binding protein 3-like isoform X2 n=1 Tax=Hibiscus syriacus TaxID=106335 RepID=UPI0019211988|nr:double-stranded RNA-binding protein 3-like isoform X2 [Hibiscus syriacus]